MDEVLSQKNEMTISPTPIILAYFAEKQRGTRKEVTKFVLDVFKRLENTTISINAVFRGDMTGSADDITSETVDNIIWYWFSNHFLEECSGPDEEDICFEAKKPLDEYRLDSISQNLKEIQWPSENERQNFLRVLREVFSS